MEVRNQDHEDLQRLAELVNEIKFAMLTTEEADGALHSRPMATVQMDVDGEEGAGGNVWFFTALSLPKVEEAKRHRQVNLSYVRCDTQDYLSISGTGEIVRDEDKMRALWTPWLKPWFPEGLDDPNLGLLKVAITDAEYWSAPGGTMKWLYSRPKV